MIRSHVKTLICLVVVWAGLTHAQEIGLSSAADRAETLVARLGDPRFAVRERATAQLIALGAPARQALEKGVTSVDREIRYRSRTVLAIIQDLDFQDRLGRFAQDADLNDNYGLPGWHRFRELVGDDRSTKPLFVSMYRAEPKLMQRADDAPAQISKALDRRCLELKQNVQLMGVRHSTSSIATLLFLAGREQLSLNAPTNSTLFFFCQQSSVGAAVRIGPLKRAYRQLLAQWLSRPQNNLPRDAMMLGMQYGIHEVLPRARQTVRDQAAKAYDRQFAILAIAKFGDPSDVPLLEPLLDDDQVCSAFRRQNAQVSVQIRDTALAAVLYLTRRDFAEFGYAGLQLHERFVFNLVTLGFAQDEQRHSAIAKWREWSRAEGQG